MVVKDGNDLFINSLFSGVEPKDNFRLNLPTLFLRIINFKMRRLKRF